MRLHGSTKPSDPHLLTGNVCAHNTNIVSTAKILPRTPSDINDNLSVIFVGSGSFDKKNLGPRSMLTVRKRKISRLLSYFAARHIQYRDCQISAKNLDMYPDGEDGDILPGLEERIIYVKEDVDKTTREEHAGI